MNKEQIIQLRERLGMTSDGFAKTLGVNPATVYRWQRGLSLPKGLAKHFLETLDNAVDLKIKHFRVDIEMDISNLSSWVDDGCSLEDLISILFGNTI